MLKSISGVLIQYDVKTYFKWNTVLWAYIQVLLAYKSCVRGKNIDGG